MADGTIGLWTVPLAVFGGAIRVSTPSLFVGLGETVRAMRAAMDRGRSHLEGLHPRNLAGRP